MNAAPNPEAAVRSRYAAGARAAEPALCCPISYDPKYLKAIPPEVIERDYGCGDPSKHVRPGETVLDLGSGTGKICFIAAQVVGAKGRVIGVDMTDDMLEVAQRAAPVVAERIGHDIVEFRKGRIQDLALDLAALERRLAAAPIASAEGWLAAEALADELRRSEPLIASDSIDVVVSNCVLNLVGQDERRQLFAEIFRVLRPGGRAVISDIVCDREPTAEMQADPDLWSGCISGAFREDRFLRAFAKAGFHGMRIIERQAEPWQTVQGIEFRSMTVEAWKSAPGACADDGEDDRMEIVYRGPFRSVKDDAGRRFRRGARVAVSATSAAALARDPYAGMFDRIGSQEGETDAGCGCGPGECC